MLRVDPHKYPEPILLAVSGGVDSMVMADLFCRKFTSFRGNSDMLAIAHCNFHLRADESDSDEAFVQAWAQKNNVRFFVKHFDTCAFAKSEKLSLEMAARLLRYRWFDSLCSEYGFAGVCVAHNANDNAETLMLNLLRGTGLKGLCAMDEISKNPYGDSLVFRPLLGFSREQIEEYAAEHSLEWHTDSSNLKSDVKRNILRNKVFPILSEINPSFVDTFGRDIRNFSQACEIVDSFVEEYEIVNEKGMIDIGNLKSLPHWEYLLYSALNERGFSAPVISDLTELLLSERILSGKTFHATNGRILASTSTHLIISDNSGENPIFPVVEYVPWISSKMDVKTPRGTILLDADKLPCAEPALRKWKEGDWLIPIGMKGKKKVSDLLTDLRYDILRKENVLVVEGQGSHVLAVVGERIDSSVKITSSTTHIWRITVPCNICR